MKLKRLLTGVLSAVMALSVCAMPALAAEVKTSTSTINTETKGSITIYKYAQTDEQEKASQKTNGNGEEIANKDTISGTLLPDAEFTLYRVKNTTQLMEYYNGLQDASAQEFKASDCFEQGKDKTAANLKPDYTTSKTAKDDPTALGKIETLTTESDGVVTFKDLSVGLYLVIETRKPDSVTKAVEPFLVSIPMTREATDTKDKDWLYNVTVYPKNSTVQGNVTLIKYGSNGKTTEELDGVQFKLYQYSRAQDEYQEVTPEGGITTGSDGQVTLSKLVKGKYVLQETGYATNKSKGYILNTTGIYAFSIDEKGQVADNKDTTFNGIIGDKVTVGDDFKLRNDTTNGATISITNYKPDLEKNVTKRGEKTSEGKKDHNADYGINENVPYTLTINVPANIAKLKTFKVVDTTLKAQLVQNAESVKVTGTKKGETESTVLASTAYKVDVSESGNNSIMTIDFKQPETTGIQNYAGGTITITYTSTLKEGAAIAGDGNVNTADLIYSRTTNTEANETPGAPDEPYQIEDQGVVYSFELNIKKTAQGGNQSGKTLDGVTFDLYKKADEGDKANAKNGKWYFRGDECAIVSGNPAKNLGLAGDETWLKVATLKTENGVDKVSGLPAGEYKLIETKTADGYNLLSEPVDAKLDLQYTTKWNLNIEYANGKETKRSYSTTTYTRDEKETTTPSEALNIVNRAGFTLPVTGGFGTLLFSGIGVLLVLAGVCVLFSMKKKNNRA